jgi:hypothetical protein
LKCCYDLKICQFEDLKTMEDHTTSFMITLGSTATLQFFNISTFQRSSNFFQKKIPVNKKKATFATPTGGIIAQSVEQRTENPCVAGSIPADTTTFAAS